MRVLDLFSCAGGAGRGYQLAGATVLGVDIVPRPRYVGRFVQADALHYLRCWLDAGNIADHFDFIHSSPPCQERNTLTTGTNRARGWGRKHVQLVPPTRDLLEATGLPYVIEQPAGHGGLIRTDLRLCMDMFPVDTPSTGRPARVWRHRDFEIGGPSWWRVEQPKHHKHTGRVRGWRHGKYYDGDYVAAYGNGGGKATVPEMQHALGIDWTTEREELTEAIPPAYTRWIGANFRLARLGYLTLAA